VDCMAQLCFRRVSSWQVIWFRAPARALHLCTTVMHQHAGVRHEVHGLAQMLAMAASRTSAWRRSF
jgi:hypothetical protein